MTWLYQHHDYGNIEGFNSGDSGSSGSSGENATEEMPSETVIRIREFISNSKWLCLYYFIFISFIFLGGPWLFYYFLLVGNNYFPMYLNYRTDVVEKGENVIEDPPDLVKIKDLYSKCYGEQSGTMSEEEKNLNVCYLNMGNSVPESKKGAGDGIPAPKVKMSLNMKAYYKLYPTPIGGFGDDKVDNDIITQNLVSRWFLNLCSYALLWYFKATYVISNIPAIIYIILFVSLIATISLISEYSAGSVVKNFMVISGGGASYLLFTTLAVICGVAACCAPLYRFNPDNLLQNVKALSKDAAYVFVYNFIPVFNPDGDLWLTIVCVCSGILRLLLMGLCLMLTPVVSACIPIFGILVIFYFMTRQTGIYYIQNNEYPLNVLNAAYLFISYISTCRGFIECMCLAFILFAFLIETKNTTYNGFGIIVLLATCIFWSCFRIFGSNTIRYNFLRHLHTDPDNESFKGENPIASNPTTNESFAKSTSEQAVINEPVSESVSNPVSESVSNPVNESVSNPTEANVSSDESKNETINETTK